MVVVESSISIGSCRLPKQNVDTWGVMCCLEKLRHDPSTCTLQHLLARVCAAFRTPWVQ